VVASHTAVSTVEHSSHDTVLKGQSGTVIDLGTNNRITGFTNGGQPGTGRQVSEAIRRRNVAVKEVADAPKGSSVSP
jgi:hypothetical protein